MKKIVFIVFLLVQFTYADELIWAKTGHRTVGEVAQKHLKGKTKRAIKKLLEGHDLAFVSSFADEIKADKRYNKFFPWHYVNYPADEKYGDTPPSEEGDVLQAIEYCVKVIKNKKNPRADRIFYLKMLVHFVGDLHQPLHVGQAEDKGGNDIQVQWFGKGSNLHRVWDRDLVDSYEMSYTELANAVPKVSRKRISKIQEGTIYDWVEESQDLANEIYTSAKTGDKLGYAYMYRYTDTVRQQLLKGGLRLAKVLNDIFK